MGATVRAAPALAVRFITRWEGLRLAPYRDCAGFWTIGVGHLVTRDRAAPVPAAIDAAEAERLLRRDLAATAASIARLVRVGLSEGQYAALLSFTFNLGGAALQASTLRRKPNAGDAVGAAAEFGKWNKAGGRVVAGLTRRRAAEAEMFGA